MPGIFCIDTSSLLHAWHRDYPIDVFETVWNNLDELINDGLLIAPEEVLLELERGGDAVYDWAKKRPNLFVESDNQVQQGVRRIVNGYPNFLPTTSLDGIWADPFVIALAQSRGATVVTGEVLVGPNSRSPRIPNICQELGVEHIEVLGMLRACGWQF